MNNPFFSCLFSSSKMQDTRFVFLACRSLGRTNYSNPLEKDIKESGCKSVYLELVNVLQLQI